MKNSTSALVYSLACVLIALSATALAQPAATQPEYELKLTDVAAPASPESPQLPPPERFTGESILDKLPKEFVGKATVVSTDGEACLSECFGGKRRQSFAAMQGEEKTRVIKVSDGAISLGQVVSQIGDDSIAEQTDDGVLLRLPLLVGPSATLVILGEDSAEVRLVTRRGAFIASQGVLVAVDATVTSWDEVTKKSTPMLPEADGKAFRPFVSAYAGSDTQLVGSTFVDLGYDAPSGYGVSLTSHPRRNEKEPKVAPGGRIMNCVFERLDYGFYSYEAHGVLIAGNKFKDCIKYGIDPHDRSTRIIIFKNVVSGTNGHGIIASREVTDSFVIDNIVKENAGTGIVLDRQCSENVIAENLVFDNKTGVAVYESAGNRFFNNLIAFNDGDGVKVRNGQNLLLQGNTIVGNSAFGVACESKRLKGHDARIAKGDDYEAKLDLEVYSNVMVANLDGMMKGRNVTSLKVSNIIDDVDMDSINKKLGGERELDLEDDDPLAGDLEEALSEFDEIINSADKTLVILEK